MPSALAFTSSLPRFPSRHAITARPRRACTPRPPLCISQTPSSLHPKSASILWLRNDLRVCDHAAIALAATAAQMVPIYIFDTSKFGMVHPSLHGFQRNGPFRALFMVEAIKDLRSALRRKGSDLIIRVGDPLESLLEIVEGMLETDMRPISVVAHKEITWEETQEERVLQRALASLAEQTGQHIDVHWVWGSTLHHVDDLPFDPLNAEVPDTLDGYRRLVDSEGLKVRAEIDMPQQFPIFPLEKFQSMGYPSLQFDLEVEGLCDPHDYAFPCHLASMHFVGGQKTAEERLREYIFHLRALEDYKDTRFQSGKRNSSSKLSPWLSIGCISPRTIYWNCKKFEQQFKQDGSSEAFISQLVARDYFRWVAASVGSKLFALNGYDNHTAIQEPIWIQPDQVEDELHIERFDRWIAGETGSPIVDANMRELAQTGFMSIHGRQITASFLIHDLQYPDWRAGAEYFESLLIDHDPTSNWGNWARIAGVTPDAEGGKQLNVVEESLLHDPDGWFLTRWLPELISIPPPMIHEPHLLSEFELADMDVVLGETYPEPIVPLPSSSKKERNESIPVGTGLLDSDIFASGSGTSIEDIVD